MTENFVRKALNVEDAKKVDYVLATQNDLIATTDKKVWVRNDEHCEQISGAVTQTYLTEYDDNDIIGMGSTDTTSIGGVLVGGIKFPKEFFTLTHDPENIHIYQVSLADTGFKTDFEFAEGFKSSGAFNNYRVLAGVLYVNINKFMWKQALTAHESYLMATLPKDIKIPQGIRIQCKITPGKLTYLDSRIEINQLNQILIYPYSDVPAQTGEDYNATNCFLIVPLGEPLAKKVIEPYTFTE